MSRRPVVTIACLSAALTSVVTGFAHSETITVTQMALTFNPSTVEARPGDTIKWQWTSFSHTVTSGTNCSSNGLFSMPLNAANPVQTFVVPEDATGTIPYFCIPHCAMGMTGTIVILQPPSPDLDGDGCVGGPDLAILLGAWGTRDAEADLDSDGTVGPADLSILLGAWDC